MTTGLRQHLAVSFVERLPDVITTVSPPADPATYRCENRATAEGHTTGQHGGVGVLVDAGGDDPQVDLRRDLPGTDPRPRRAVGQPLSLPSRHQRSHL